MALMVGELYLKVRALCENVMELTAGKDCLELPVFRVNVVCDRASASGAQKYDAVFFQVTSHKRCSVLDAAEILSAKSASMLVVCRDEYCMYELVQLRLMCDNLGMPLIELESVEQLPSVMHRFYEEIFKYEKSMLALADLVKSVIHLSDCYGLFRDRLEENGFFEHSEYCACVLYFVNRKNADDYECSLPRIARFLETEMSKHTPMLSVIYMERRIAAIFVDIESERASELIKLGLEAIPDDLSERYDIYIGMSGKAEGIRSLSGLIMYAYRLAVLHTCTGSDRSFSEQSGQGLSRFVVSLSDRSTIDFYVKNTLQLLVKYDRTNQTEYIRFLRVYFRNNCSLQRTADELFVHRNSVNYSLRKIESIIGSSLSDVNTKLELLLALRLDEAYGMEISRQAGLDDEGE